MANVIPNAILLQDSEVLKQLFEEYGSNEFWTQWKQQSDNWLQNVIYHRDVSVSNTKDENFLCLHELFETLWNVENRDWKRSLPYGSNSSSPGSHLSERSSLAQSFSSIGSILDSTASSSLEIPSNKNVLIAEKVLRHGKHKNDIYMLFRELDPKTCAHVRKVDGTQRRISKPHIMGGIRRPSLVSIGPVPTSPKRKPKTLSRFPNKEEEDLYRYMLRCAYNPTLASLVRMPSPTPIPGVMNGHGTEFLDDNERLDVGPNDPCMLVEKLIKVFGINHYLHNRFLKASNIQCDPLNATISLATDLVDLRRRINSNNFKGCIKKEKICPPNYDEDCFKARETFLNWKRHQLKKVNNRIQEWCPEYANKEKTRPHPFDIINGYRILLKKFFTFDWKEKNEMISMARGSIRFNVLFCDSERLLKEYALRYGVPETFQRICLLESLTQNFQFSDWYLGCFDQNLLEIDLFLRGEYELLSNDEKDMMREALQTLLKKIKYCFEKTFSIHNIDCKSEMNSVILILEKAVELLNKFHFSPTYVNVEDLLLGYCQKAGEKYYEQQKLLVALNFSDDNDDADRMTSIRFRTLLQNLKSSIRIFQDLCRHCPTLQRRCQQLVGRIANTLYDRLMIDFAVLCCDTASEINSVDSVLIGLCYRLNSLDEDWKEHLKTNKEKWRMNFAIILATVNSTLSDFLQKDVAKFILEDEMKIIDYCPTQIIISESSSRSEPVEFTKNKTDKNKGSPQSITPSISSAFENYRRQSVTQQRIISNLRRGSHFKVEGRISSTPSSTHSTITRESDGTLHEIISSILNDMVSNVERELAIEENVIIDIEDEESDEDDNEVAATLSQAAQNGLLSAGTRNLSNPTSPPIQRDGLISSEPYLDSPTRSSEPTPDLEIDVSDNSTSTDTTKFVRVTSSVIDLMIVCFRLLNLKQNIFDYVLPLNHNEECTVNCPHDDYKKLRRNNCFTAFNSISLMFKRYARLVLSMDLCGMNLFLDERIKNKESVMMLVEQCQNEKGWPLVGCRHALSYPTKPNPSHCIYLKTLLEKSGDKWELITKEMCYRINNIWGCIDLTPSMEQKAMQCFQLSKEDMLCGESKDSYTKQNKKNDFKRNILSTEFEECEEHLLEIIDLQIELIASKAVYIYKVLFSTLIGMQCSEKMDPCVNYVTDQLTIFRHYLIDKAFIKVALKLWKAICQLYYRQLSTLHKTKVNPYDKVSKLEKTLKKQLEIFEISLQGIDRNQPNICGNVNMFRRNRMIGRKLHKHSMATFFRLHVFSKRNSSLDYLYMQCIQFRQNTYEYVGNYYKYEECYYLMKKFLRNQMNSPIFTNHDFLEFLSPGWRVRNNPRQRENKTDDISSIILEERKEIGRNILQSCTNSRERIIQLEFQDRPSDIRAELVLKHYTEEGFVSESRRRSTSHILMSGSVRIIDERRRRNRPIVILLDGVPKEQVTRDRDEKRLKFLESHQNASAFELTGRLYDILRKKSMVFLPDDVLNDILFKWKYMARTRETDQRDVIDNFNVEKTLAERGHPVRPCSCRF